MAVMYGISPPPHTNTFQGFHNITTILSPLDNFLASDHVTNWLTGPAALIVDVVVFLLGQRYEKNRDRSEAKKRFINTHRLILNELVSITSYFKSKENFLGLEKGYLRTSAYQSVLNSGLFTELNDKVQGKLATLYSEIYKFNEYKKFLDQHEDDISDPDLRIAWQTRKIEYDKS